MKRAHKSDCVYISLTICPLIIFAVWSFVVQMPNGAVKRRFSRVSWAGWLGQWLSHCDYQQARKEIMIHKWLLRSPITGSTNSNWWDGDDECIEEFRASRMMYSDRSMAIITTSNDHLDQRDNNLIMLGKSEMDNIVGFIGYLGAFHYWDVIHYFIHVKWFGDVYEVIFETFLQQYSC